MQDVLKELDQMNQVEMNPDIHSAAAKKLWHAAEDGDVEGIRSAIKDGIDVNLQQGDEALGRTGLGSASMAHLGPSALHLACMFGQVAAVEELLKSNASTTVMTDDGNTPLHMAVIGNKAAIVELLVKAGADVNAKNEFEESPKDMAQMMGLNLPALQ